MIPEVLKYNLVVPVLSRQIRTFLVIGLFILGMAIAYLIEIFVYPGFPVVIIFLIYILFLFLISKPVMKVRVIGEIILNTDHIHLSNIENNQTRRIEIDSVKSLFIKKGMAASLVISKWKKTLIIEMILNNDEIVEAQIGKRRNDLETADDITKYCESQKIPVNRRI